MRRNSGWTAYGRLLVLAVVAAAVALPLVSIGSAGQSAASTQFSIDHFKCYSASGKLAPRTVSLRDQFGAERVVVSRPVSLCAPVDKNGEGIRNDVDHLTCYEIKSKANVNRKLAVDNQFGSQIVEVGSGETLCVPSLKTELDQIETDLYCCVVAVVTLTYPDASVEELTLTGSAKVHVHIGPTGGASDTDGDARDQVAQELVELDLKGKSSMGPATLTLQAMPSVGEIEETANVMAGILDLAPFGAGGSASSFFDVFFMLQLGGQVFHNMATSPMHIEARITHKPSSGEMYTKSGPALSLLDANNNPSGVVLGPAEFTP